MITIQWWTWSVGAWVPVLTQLYSVTCYVRFWALDWDDCRLWLWFAWCLCVHTILCCENWDLNNLFPNYVEMFYCSGYSQYFSFKFFFVVEFFRCTSVKVLRLEHLSPLWGSLLKIKSVGVRIEVYTDLHRGHPCLSQKKRPMSHPSFFLHLDGRTKALCRVRTQVQCMQRDIRTSF